MDTAPVIPHRIHRMVLSCNDSPRLDFLEGLLQPKASIGSIEIWQRSRNAATARSRACGEQRDRPRSTVTVDLEIAKLTIGTLARRTGPKVQTICCYERIGLMPEPGRTAGGPRRYGEAELDRLAFIRHDRQLEFTLGAPRTELERMVHG